MTQQEKRGMAKVVDGFAQLRQQIEHCEACGQRLREQPVEVSATIDEICDRYERGVKGPAAARLAASFPVCVTPRASTRGI